MAAFEHLEIDNMHFSLGDVAANLPKWAES